MKKSKSRKKIAVIIGAILLLVIVIGLISMWPLLSMRPAATGNIEGTEIIAVNNGMNSLYFLPSNDGFVAIDAGTNAEKARQAMAEMGIDPLDVKHVLLTHSDSDHIAALALFTNAQVYMSEDELQMLDGTTKRNATQFNSLPDGVDRESFVLLQAWQELEVGGHRIVCIKTPGHTPGSMTYKLNGSYLFTGDAVRIADRNIVIAPFTMDEETAGASIQVIREVMRGCELVLTAHYGYRQCGILE